MFVQHPLFLHRILICLPPYIMYFLLRNGIEVDHWVGKLVRKIRAAGLDSNTLIVFTGKNLEPMQQLLCCLPLLSSLHYLHDINNHSLASSAHFDYPVLHS